MHLVLMMCDWCNTMFTNVVSFLNSVGVFGCLQERMCVYYYMSKTTSGHFTVQDFPWVKVYMSGLSLLNLGELKGFQLSSLSGPSLDYKTSSLSP